MPLGRQWAKHKTIQAARAIATHDRYVDFGIRLWVVEQDPAGVEVLAGRPKVRLIRSHEFGGVLDSRTHRFVGPTKQPVVWYGSKEQVEAVIHDRDLLKPKLQVYGAEGSGKTRGVLAPWVVMRALEFTGQWVEIGVTAPTQLRLGTVVESLHSIMAPEWYSFHVNTGLFRLVNGTRIRCLSTTKRSEEGGSPIQGWDWAAAAGDEFQDSFAVNDDIEARGRRAPGGVYRRLNTLTSKDSSSFRTFRDAWNSNPLCETRRLEGITNPFVDPQHWQNLRTMLDERSYKRRVLALDVGPEQAVYHTFERPVNLRPVPQIGARNITEQLLRVAGFGAPLGLLIGHDPGNVRDVSLLLRAYSVGTDPEPHWYVVGEVVTEQSTTEVHGLKLAKLCQTLGVWGELAPYQRPLVIADPQSEFEARGQPHPTVYRTLKKLGFEIRSASPQKHRVPIEARIAMVVSLLRNAAGKSRLFIATDDRGRPAAPGLLEALEMAERDAAGAPETKVKNQRAKRKDYSDFTSALGFALWRLERERVNPRPKVTDYATTS